MYQSLRVTLLCMLVAATGSCTLAGSSVQDGPAVFARIANKINHAKDSIGLSMATLGAFSATKTNTGAELDGLAIQTASYAFIVAAETALSAICDEEVYVDSTYSTTALTYAGLVSATGYSRSTRMQNAAQWDDLEAMVDMLQYVHMEMEPPVVQISHYYAEQGSANSNGVWDSVYTAMTEDTPTVEYTDTTPTISEDFDSGPTPYGIGSTMFSYAYYSVGSTFVNMEGTINRTTIYYNEIESSNGLAATLQSTVTFNVNDTAIDTITNGGTNYNASAIIANTWLALGAAGEDDQMYVYLTHPDLEGASLFDYPTDWTVEADNDAGGNVWYDLHTLHVWYSIPAL